LTPRQDGLKIPVEVNDLFPACVVTNQPAAEAQVLLTLDVPREVWSAHIQPAQYVDLVLPEMPPWRGTIANRPGRERFEFLVKDVGERSHRIATLAPGEEIQTTLPLGDGFPVLVHRRMDIVMVACGVAICAMRPVVEEILLQRTDWHRVVLFYGERTADRFAFTEERERWRESDIEVHLSASRPSEGTYWSGHAGYVQDRILEVAPDVRDAVAFLAGKDGMIDEARSALMRLNLPENRIILNL